MKKKYIRMKRGLVAAKKEVLDTEGHRSRLLITALWILNILFFVWLWVKGLRNDRLNYFSTVYLTIPFTGALLGYRRVYKLPDKDRLALILLCFGLMSWALGCIIWLYYNLKLHEEIPYPSLADGGYLTCLLCLTVVVVLLYRQLGRELLQDLQAVGAYLVIFWSCTIGLMLWAHEGSLSRFSPARDLFKFALDVSYPVVDAFNLALFLTLLAGPKVKRLSAGMKRALWIIYFGYAVLLIGDLSFNVLSSFPATSRLAYFNGGPTDAVFATAFYILSMGMFYIPAQTKKPLGKTRRR